MDWNNVDVWRRHRQYVTAELRKEAPALIARMGFASTLALVVGIAEGARLSELQGGLRFPFRYALYNLLPSFVGGTVPAKHVAAAMANEPPPIRSCPRAATQAQNLRALRTAVAGCAALSVVLQMTIAGRRGADAHQKAVMEGREVPRLFMGSLAGRRDSTAWGVLRLCGIRGLEHALLTAQREREQGIITPVFPIVIASRRLSSESSCAGLSWLPEGALAAVTACSPNPAYFRVDPPRLFSPEAWHPVARGLTGGSNSCDEKVLLVVEADTLSSGAPQTLLTGAAGASRERIASARERDSTHAGDGGCLEADKAAWAVAMLRQAIEEHGRRSGGVGVTSVILAGMRVPVDEEGSTIAVDARAALLLSVLTWVQQCTDEAVAEGQNVYIEEEAAVGGKKGESSDLALPAGTMEADAPLFCSTGDASKAVTKAVDSKSSTTKDVDEGLTTDNAAAETVDRNVLPSVTTVAGMLEGTGRGLRHVVALTGRLRSPITRSLREFSSWFVPMDGGNDVGKRGSCVGRAKVLLYDTDDEESFRWLAAQMLCQGWTVRRIDQRLDPSPAPGSSPRSASSDDIWEDIAAVSGAPILVHHCNDEITLSVAARHMARDKGRPVCTIVHQWNCGAQAHRLLSRPQGTTASLPTRSSAGRRGSVEVICAAEIGEGLLDFVRTKLRSGARPGEVQGLLDDLFGRFYEPTR